MFVKFLKNTLEFNNILQNDKLSQSHLLSITEQISLTVGAEPVILLKFGGFLPFVSSLHGVSICSTLTTRNLTYFNNQNIICL
jgi:hypothetical protein